LDEPRRVPGTDSGAVPGTNGRPVPGTNGRPVPCTKGDRCQAPTGKPVPGTVTRVRNVVHVSRTAVSARAGRTYCPCDGQITEDRGAGRLLPRAHARERPSGHLFRELEREALPT